MFVGERTPRPRISQRATIYHRTFQLIRQLSEAKHCRYITAGLRDHTGAPVREINVACKSRPKRSAHDGHSVTTAVFRRIVLRPQLIAVRPKTHINRHSVAAALAALITIAIFLSISYDLCGRARANCEHRSERLIRAPM